VGGIKRRAMVQVDLNINVKKYLKQKGLGVWLLPSKHEALSSSPSNTKNKTKNKQKNEGAVVETEHGS
jgi:hypothetical protein